MDAYVMKSNYSFTT